MADHIFHTEDLSNKSFLITGGAGFIGGHICEYLLKHGAAKVRAFDNMVNGFEKTWMYYVNTLPLNLWKGISATSRHAKLLPKGLTMLATRRHWGLYQGALKNLFILTR